VEEGAGEMKRGSNQSTDTKRATAIICDALDILKSGRADRAKELIEFALWLLPDIDNSTQRTAEGKASFRAIFGRCRK
jgi:hypothetical protein